MFGFENGHNESDDETKGRELKNMGATAAQPIMTGTTKLSSRGQIVIPLEIRRAIGAKDGDQILFSLNGDGKGTWEIVKTPTVDEVFGILHRQGLEDVRADDESVQTGMLNALAKDKMGEEDGE